MRLVPSSRLAGATLALGAVALGSIIAGESAASTPSTAAAAGPQKNVRAARVTPRKGTLAPGTRVGSARLGQRVFTDAGHGFALASVGGAQYPAATSDRGRTWMTDGPALHVNAAQGPLAVVDIGAISRRTIFAYGGGSAIDATSDGGRTWYSALFGGLVMAVVRGDGNHLVAFVDGSEGRRGVTWQYVSKNGGRSWRYDSRIGGT